MPQVARVDPVHRQQHVQVGDAEVHVVRRLAADPGAEAQIAAEQGGQLGAADGHRRGARDPREQRPHPVLLGRQVLGADPVPGTGGEGAAVGERDGAAARQPLVAPFGHVAGYAGPDQPDDGAVAVVGWTQERPTSTRPGRMASSAARSNSLSA